MSISRQPLYGRYCAGDDAHRDLYQCQFVYRRAWAAYKYGLGWVLLAMIQLPAVWLSLGILGKKFAILARRYNAVTLNDMLFARYQSRLLRGWRV